MSQIFVLDDNFSNCKLLGHNHFPDDEQSKLTSILLLINL